MLEKRKKLTYWLPQKDMNRLRKKFPDRYFEDMKIVVRKSSVQMGRWKHLGPNDVALSFTTYEDLDALIRFLTKHYPDKYWEERDKVEEWNERITYFNRELGRWKKLGEGYKLSIASGLEAIADELPQDPYAKDEDKMEARDRLRNCSVAIKYDYPNVGAVRAVLVASRNRLNDRIENTMDNIRSEYRFRGMLAESIRKDFKKRFNKVKTKTQGLRNSLFNKDVKALHRIRGKIGYEFNLLRNITTEPYTMYVKRVDHILTQELRQAINEKDLAKVMRHTEEVKQLAKEVLTHIEEQERQSG